MSQKRDQRGRFTSKARWEKLIVLSMVVAIPLGIISDIFLSELNQPVYASTEEVIEAVEVPVRIEIVYTKDGLKDLVWEKAAKYNTFPDRMWNTIKCENPQLDPKLQSLIVKDGIREDSWGLAQFHLPSKNRTAEGKVITKTMAQTPEIALDAMAYHFSIGNARLWTCYRNLY